MSAIEHVRLARALLASVLEAGRVEMHHYNAGVVVETKADRSPVTLADREAEAILVAGIADAAPGVPVIAEEAVAEGRLPQVGDTFFLVDPLDGTREFINHRGEFTVNVALVVNRRPDFGIVYAPALGELYLTLAVDRAAFARIMPQAPTPSLGDLKLDDIRARRPDPARLAAVASRSHLTPETAAFLARYDIAKRHDAGSSLKFCLIARGEADIYPRLGPTMEWDTAAGQAVLTAAGGSVTRLDGTPLDYGKSGEGYRNPHFIAWGGAGPIAPAR
jgi:3'(2'), 5'-bisphosphate nucleotidase